METCANCQRTIGKLETPELWEESVVCHACHELLAKAAPATPTPVPENVSEPWPANVCPSCGSGDVQKASVAHASGTSTSVGVIGGSNDFSAIGVGQSQTHLAKQCAPPSGPSSIMMLLFYAIGGVSIVAAFINFGSIPSALPVVNNSSCGLWSKSQYLFAGIASLVAGLIFLPIGWMFTKDVSRRKAEHYQQMKRWGRTWVCRRCGHLFFEN